MRGAHDKCRCFCHPTSVAKTLRLQSGVRKRRSCLADRARPLRVQARVGPRRCPTPLRPFCSPLADRGHPPFPRAGAGAGRGLGERLRAGAGGSTAGTPAGGRDGSGGGVGAKPLLFPSHPQAGAVSPVSFPALGTSPAAGRCPQAVAPSRLSPSVPWPRPEPTASFVCPSEHISRGRGYSHATQRRATRAPCCISLCGSEETRCGGLILWGYDGLLESEVSVNQLSEDSTRMLRIPAPVGWITSRSVAVSRF